MSSLNASAPVGQARRLGGIDNRGSHFYLTLYWAEALATQSGDAELQSQFTPIAKALANSETKIVEELIAVQGKPVDTAGYFQPDDEKTAAAMRPSQTFHAIVAGI